MKILGAPQALKGSLDAATVARAIEAGIRRALAEAEVVALPVADGGEGTVDALVAATGGELREATVTGPLGETMVARFGLLGTNLTTVALPNAQGRPTAVIEMAAASGLPLVPAQRRDPRITTTRGTDDLIPAAFVARARP